MYLLKDKLHHLSQIGEKVNDLQNKHVYLKPEINQYGEY